jgi:GntR family transcriptional regulator
MTPFSEHILLDFRSGIPIFTQIMDQIKQQVVSGMLKPGDQLPTVRALAAELRVNFNTVARAYRLLDETGVISTQHGRGTYILEVPPVEVQESMRNDSMRILTERYLLDATRLGFSVKEIRATIKQQTTGSINNNNQHE